MGRTAPLKRDLNVIEVHVRRQRSALGAPVVDCWDPYSSRSWRGVPLLSAGGGVRSAVGIPISEDPLASVPSPVVTGARALILLRDGIDAVCCLGLYHDERAVPLLPEAPEPPPDADRLPQPSVRDAYVLRAGSLVTIDAMGRVTVDATQAVAPEVRIQLPPTGTLRISRGGVATARPALAAPVTQQLDALKAAVEALTAWAQALKVVVTTGAQTPDSAAAAAAVPKVPATPPLASAAVQVPADVDP
ncbi:MAG: hypothetical protein AMXMBFR64_45750 [Myxococcales bacterium]